MAELAYARRRLLSLGGLAAGGLAGGLGLAGCTGKNSSPSPPNLDAGSWTLAVVATPPEARDEWAKLAEGNARYAAGKATHDRQDDPEYRRELRNGSEPWACVLSCIDARVPPELIFDVGLGDMVTVRSAGETIDRMVRGSVEFAVEQLGVRLVMVLGHSDCSAVGAAVQRVRREDGEEGQSGESPLPTSRRHEMDSIAEQIGEAVRRVPHVDNPEVYAAKCAGMQAVAATERLLSESELLSDAAHREDDDAVSVVPAIYNIGTGLVQRVTASRIERG